MPADKRLLAADAFWRDGEDDARLQHVEAIVALAQRMRFRTRSVQALPIEKRAKQLSQMIDVSDSIATRALIAYHFTHARPLMSAFLDQLGLEHDNGQITAETLSAPDSAKLRDAVGAIRDTFPSEDVALYLRTLATLDAETWGELEQITAE